MSLDDAYIADNVYKPYDAGFDKINPKHYRDSEIEPIEVIEDWDLSFHLGNAIKYIKRAGQKEGQTFEDDIQKAIWYLQRSIRKA